MKEFVEENLSAETVLGQEQNKDLMSNRFEKMMTKLRNFYNELMDETNE